MTTISTSAESKKLDSPHVTVHGSAQGFAQEVTSGRHHFRVDEPTNVGGMDSAPDPYDYLMGALGACTSMTIGLHARRKGIPLEGIAVHLRHSRIHAKDCEDCETKQGMLDRIDIEIDLSGPITAEQHQQLLAIAEKCPVKRTLTSEIQVRVRAA